MGELCGCLVPTAGRAAAAPSSKLMQYARIECSIVQPMNVGHGRTRSTETVGVRAQGTCE